MHNPTEEIHRMFAARMEAFKLEDELAWQAGEAAWRNALCRRKPFLIRLGGYLFGWVLTGGPGWEMK